MGVAIFCLIAGRGLAAEICEPVVGHIVSIEGRVEVQRTGEQVWQPAGANETLCQDDTIRVGARSRAAIALVNDAVLRLDQNTAVRLLNVVEKEEERSLLSLITGAIQSFSRQPRLLSVNTPYLNAAIEGTEFVVRVERTQAQLTVFEGQVLAANEYGRVAVAAGESVVAQAGQAPVQRIAVRPRDAAQWALYYPPVLAVLGGRTGRVPEDLPAPLAEALALAGRGEFAAALERLDRVPTDRRDSRFNFYRAALLLSVGRSEEADSAIALALRQDPGSGLAYALLAVIDVARNRKGDALANGRRAVELSPRSAAAKIALSYAQQANFQLAAARDTLLQAVAQQPDDPLARARLAELWLSLGYRGRAREAAEAAAQIDPGIARTHVVLGFAALAEIRTDRARESFDRAIALAPGDALPRLGLGLAMIRDGDLADGRQQIEIAVGLDSENALMRAYLGKAYFAEKRAPLDAEQFALAKGMDPLDPTAYLYDAIRKQSENRPGDALDDIQRSIAANDNRAVYRGRLQLDEDRAARGASLARVYSDLGFHQAGVNEATKSLADDPTNASAHRFLSDAYAGMRRREISRVSEQLQAQMLQDVNINPVPPSVSETNLNIITSGGPASAGFNEFTPLFERNQARLDASGAYGEDDTIEYEGVVSAIYDWLSISAGGYHYETDGWRGNHGIEHDIQNVYVQAALTPDLNLQLEYRHRDSISGDLALNFNPDDFLLVKERDLDQDIARIGLRYSPSPDSDALLSVIYSDREGRLTQSEFRPSPPGIITEVSLDDLRDDEGYQAEAQYVFRRDRYNVTAGFAFSDLDRYVDKTETVVFTFVPPAPPTPPIVNSNREIRDRDLKHYRGYVYANIKIPASVTWTAGVSYDDYTQDEPVGEDLAVDKINPKFGVQWHITPALRFRGAAFRTVKPALAANRTIEPTQVAGFNQFFDDINATTSWRYGGGFDWRLGNDLFVGVEGTWRDLDEPVRSGSTFVFEERKEQSHRAYLNWIPLPELALSAGFVYDRFESELGLATQFDVVPDEVETISVPIGVRYFHRSGFFAGVSASYVDQEVDRSSNTIGLADGSDSFFVVDAAVGYRLPNRHGIISLSVQNLLNEEFNYQDDSFREFEDEPSIGPYIPARTILGRITLNF